jgi:hypothetical protein
MDEQDKERQASPPVGERNYPPLVSLADLLANSDAAEAAQARAFLEAAYAEVERLNQEYRDYFRSPHEAYVFLLRELDAVRTEVWKNDAEVDGVALYQALLRVAAVCARSIQDLCVIRHR